MSTRTFPKIALLVALAVTLSAWPSRLAAETHDATTVTLGWQTENADLVVVGAVAADVATSGASVELRVDQVLKGDAAVGSSILVRSHDHGCSPVWRAGLAHLVFLRRAESSNVPLCGAFSVRAIEPGTTEARLPAVVASLRAALGAGEPGPLRAALVAGMDDADAGIVWSAATDFVRHRELHAGLTTADAARVVEAFRRQPVGKNTKDALALAVAATGSAEAVPVLVDALLLPEAARIRASVSEALRRLDTANASALVASKLDDAKPAQRTALLGALAVVGAASAVPSVTPLLADEDPGVRIEAAAALGGIARNLRARDPEARLGVATAMSDRLAGDGADSLPENEIRALLWSLTQLDEPAAFDAVREVADRSGRPEVREWAKRLLARPRQSLLLGS